METKTTAPAPEKGRAKCQTLREIEKSIQKEWEQNKIFEADAPENLSTPHFSGNFPYPYMNGRLHLGHTFTLSKVEFTMTYQRLKGKHTLFPFAFHCTGMPIKACADKLQREIAEFGNPPNFPVEAAPAPVAEEKPEEPADAKKEAPKGKTKDDPLAHHSQKSKAKSKSGGETRQWNIMKMNDISESDISKFSDAQHWLKYFPPLCQEDLKLMGLGVDWRRSFITTDMNPYYDSFIRWQFETLKDKGKVKFGKRNTIWSPKDGQPCADHDRSAGEGVVPQDYTLIKVEVLEPFPAKLAHLQGKKKVYLVPGTLRPETMYGQTNVWVLPDGRYGAFEINDKEVFICTHRSARNMSFQDMSKEFGKTNCVAELTGWDILGIPVKAPLAKYPVVYTLPMLTISESKGTGIVTSVPSDAPDDYICLEELKRKPAFRQKFKIEDHMVMPYEVVPIIDVPGYGTQSAVTACAEMKVKSPNDKDLLAAAKEKVYTKGFYEGKMLVGPHAGKLVQEAKPLIKEQMIANGEAAIYSEPADLVISRSGDECVVCLTDQWYMDYGEPSWRAQVEKCLTQMEFYNPEVKKQFEVAVGWLGQWACSRTYGLGTRLPWDPQYLIESLSDSTIYMAYYTIAHFLHSDIYGNKPGKANATPDQFTRKVWDYIFLDNAPFPENCGIDPNALKAMKREFDYWYPFDIRVSGKDLIQNHLVFALYNHVALFPPSKWPRSMRANGHILLDGEKMAKSRGNFLTLAQAVEKYSVDGMRIGLADAGDGVEDANFETSNADNAVLRLYTQLKWIEDLMAHKDQLVKGPPTRFYDLVFQSQINQAIQLTDAAYSKTNFREALKTGFFDLQSARDAYRVMVGEQMNADLIFRFLEVQALLLCPIAPHFAEHVWKLTGHGGSILKAAFPVAGPIDATLLKKNQYLQDNLHEFRLKRESFLKPKAKGPAPQPPTVALVTVARTYPEIQGKTLVLLRPLFERGIPDKAEIMKVLSTNDAIKAQLKKIMSFVAFVTDEYKKKGISVFNLEFEFDEKQFIEENAELFKKELQLNAIEVRHADEQNKDNLTPGTPHVTFK